MRAIVWLLAAAPIAFAQLDNDTIMVTVMREANVQPDQAVVAVSVMAPPSVALEDVLSLLAKADMTAEDLASTQESTTASTQWWFAKPVIFSKLNVALTALASAAETGKQKDPEIDVLYSIQGTAISDELRAAYPCVLPSVLSDAQRQAQNIAAAARVRVGSIVAMADETGLQGAVSYPTAISGTFGPAPYPAFGNLTNPRPSRLCLMTVQFKLLR